MNTLSGSEVADLAGHECWELLREATIGRLAVVVGGRPEIFPVNFVVDHGTIVFRSAPGGKLSGAVGHQLSGQQQSGRQADTAAAFEADGHDPDEATAWSVVILGQLEALVSVDPVTTAALPLYPLQPGPKPRFVRVVPDTISGRRFRTVDPATWDTSPTVGRSQAWE